MPADLLARQTIYKGRIFHFDVDVVKLPTGHTIDMEVVRHPGSVVLLPIPEPGKIILIKQYRYTIDRHIWELPAGTLKPGEHPEKAAIRECEEEIGLVPHKVSASGSYFPTPGFCDEVMNYFRCEDLRPPAADSTVRKDDDEDIEPRAFTIAEARQLVQSGEIVDLKTVAGLAML
jgi:ADP-ribose pyrophosphatase